MKTAACYIRVSTEDQLEYSPDAQIRELKNYAASHDLYIDPAHIYMDEGISGRKTKNRAAFLHMIAAAKAKPKPFEVILLWKFSRFARNREDAIVYKSMLRKLGIEVISITENIGDDKMSVLIEAMIEAMDEYYSLNLGEEVRRGMTEKALQGGVQTAPSLGYDKPKDSPVYVINPQEAAIVRKIHDLWLSGNSLTGVARQLNLLGYKTKRGNNFDARHIEYIICNPVYKGMLRWTPTKAVGLRIYDNPATIIIPGGHEPIIDDETWDKSYKLYCAKRAARKPHERAADTKKHYLSGLLFCGHCGAKMTYNAAHDGFQCWRYSKGMDTNSCFFSSAKLEQQIIAALDELADSNGDITYRKQQTILPDEANKTILEEIKKLETVLTKAKNAYLAGIDTMEEYGSTKRNVLSKIKLLKNSLNLEAQSESTSEIISASQVKQVILSNLPQAKKNEALSVCFQKIICIKKPEEEIRLVLR